MNDYLSRAGKTILIMLVVVLSVAYVNHRKPAVVFIPDPNIPSALDIQQRLKDLDVPRYDPGKVDGIIGKQSITAWDNYSCDQHAKRAIEGE